MRASVCHVCQVNFGLCLAVYGTRKKIYTWWRHLPRYWPFVRGIHWSPMNSPHKGQWRRALVFYLICAWINAWVNNRAAGDLRRHRAHHDVIVMDPLLAFALVAIISLLALCDGNQPVAGGFPSHRPEIRSFDVLLNKHSGCRQSEMPCRSCDITVM